jgi:hypothetical protein
MDDSAEAEGLISEGLVTEFAGHACPDCGLVHKPERRVRVKAHSSITHPIDGTIILNGQVLDLPESTAKQLRGHVRGSRESHTADVGALLMLHAPDGELRDLEG